MVYEILLTIRDTYISMAPYLLIGLTCAGILRVFFSPHFVAHHLGGNKVSAIVNASLFGVPLPLCSCGVVPTALSLRKSNASESATVSFLISTPQTGIDSIIATYGMLGPVFAIFRPLAAFLMGIAGGITVLIFGDKKPVVAAKEKPECTCKVDENAARKKQPNKLTQFWNYSFHTFLDDISVHLVIGIFLAGLISAFVPEEFFAQTVGNEFVTMLLMIIGGIPLYICATASIPIAVALIAKGVSPGAAFVFLAVGPVTNAASLVLIGHSLGKKVTALYLGAIALTSILAGMLFNAFLDSANTTIIEHIHLHQHNQVPYVKLFFALLFGVLLVISLYRNARDFIEKRKSRT
ncbi:MAG: SO_0444 family Cu/Zn efflux transporter [Chitinivibrionales bacterium]|nr:SO_0444 family Cu/Zn efflux transporter [Chitinivibrionales bacterium]